MPAHKVIQPTKQCRVCPNIFSKPPHTSNQMWESRETCSKRCGATHKNKYGTYTLVTKFCKNSECEQPFTKKKKDTHEHFAKQEYCSVSCGKVGKKGESNNSWAGDDIGYFGIHTWMQKTYGKPQFCEYCKRSDDRMYHWANLSGKYLRDRKDWARLCVPHHSALDKGKIVIPTFSLTDIK